MIEMHDVSENLDEALRYTDKTEKSMAIRRESAARFSCNGVATARVLLLLQRVLLLYTLHVLG